MHNAPNIDLIVTWRGNPLRFAQVNCQPAHEVVAEPDATRFATEDDAFQAAANHGLKWGEFAIQPIRHGEPI